MGLFSFIGRALSPLGNIILGAHDNKKAIDASNAALQLGLTNGKADIANQLNASQTRLDPYETAGTDALSAIRDQLGLNGDGAQASSIAGVKSSPLFQALFGTGQSSALAAASATGGIRGGNINQVLAQNGENAFAQVLQQHLADLGGLSSQGLGATEFGAGLGSNAASKLADLDVGSGQSNAGAIGQKAAVTNNMFSSIQQLIKSAIGGGVGGIGGAVAGGVGGGGSPTFGGGSQGNPAGVLSLFGGSGGSGGFDVGSALKSLLANSGGMGGGISPLSAISGGALNNAIPTDYKF